MGEEYTYLLRILPQEKGWGREGRVVFGHGNDGGNELLLSICIQVNGCTAKHIHKHNGCVWIELIFAETEN